MEVLLGALSVLLVAAVAVAASRSRQLHRLTAELAERSRAVTEAGATSGRSQDLAASLAGALDALALGVVVVDRSGEVVFRNRPAASLVAPRHGDALAARAVSDLVQEARAGGVRSRSIELFGPPRRTLELSAEVLDGDDAALAVVIEDVSDRRRLDAVRSDFVANVSHELKTPVAALGLLAETLVGEDDLGVVRRLAERMNTEAFRVARIIEDLLDLSRLEAEQSPSHEPVAVAVLVAQAVDQVRAHASLGDVALAVTEVPPGWAVMGERRQLVSALANLLENAVKYSNPGSSVEVSARNDGDWVDLVVQDHGIGIPSRDLDRVFERFYRVDRGRGRDTGGTGLGLSIVRHVATNHSGEVTVESHEGEGSAFTLRLPAEAVAAAAMAEAG
ncbi:MAG: sensor histidine kinase [Acidimicrobiales bacterium]